MQRLPKLRVHPDSKRSAIKKKSDDAYEVWVKLRIIKGMTSPSKIVEVLGSTKPGYR